jgi:predicted O-linked N-acetylglucosamine transferase (SPINDLY family)
MDYRISDPQLDPPSPNDPVEIPHGLSPSPRPRGEGWGEGSLFSEQRADIRSNAPSRLPSPRVQGEGEKAGLPKSLEPSGENRNPPKNHPLAENRDALYIERTLRLPETFWCYDPLEADLPVNDPPSRATGHIAFGCLNNFFKTNPPTLRRWAAILRQVPGSRLILQAPQGAARTRVLNIFAEESIAPDRIDFVTKMPRLEYLATYHKIDIALDTYPYNGHTTSLDAFWMGVPVITLFGEPVVSRGTLSQLTNLGLTELAADDPNAFIAKAIELAADPDRLGKIRRTLRPAMEQSALMDAGRFTANLEKNFILAWEKWLGA